MAIRLHGSACTTPRIRAELQLATGSPSVIAQALRHQPQGRVQVACTHPCDR